MTHHIDAELLPCPFCGATPTMHKHYKWAAWNLVHRCKVVGAISFDFVEDKKLHVDRWNSRTPGAAPQSPEAAPMRRPLTEDEIDRLADETDILYVSSGCGDYGSNREAIEPFARAIERAHGVGAPS